MDVIKMIHKYIIFFLCFIFSFFSCGGGGGKYYPPQVTINKIGLIKTEITNPRVDEKLKFSLQVELDRKPEKEKFITGAKYYYFNNFEFKNKRYLLAIPIDDYVSIFDSNQKLIKKLSAPRYTTNAAALELTGKNATYLAIFIQQQTTSHSSTLFILNEVFDVVYKEHLLGALWMAREPSELGHNLIISAETKWMPKGKWISVGGPWRYKIFK